jgi:ribonuclease HI
MDAPDPSGRARTVQCPVYFMSKVLHEVKTR